MVVQLSTRRPTRRRAGRARPSHRASRKHRVERSRFHMVGRGSIPQMGGAIAFCSIVKFRRDIQVANRKSVPHSFDVGIVPRNRSKAPRAGGRLRRHALRANDRRGLAARDDPIASRRDEHRDQSSHRRPDERDGLPQPIDDRRDVRCEDSQTVPARSRVALAVPSKVEREHRAGGRQPWSRTIRCARGEPPSTARSVTVRPSSSSTTNSRGRSRMTTRSGTKAAMAAYAASGSRRRGSRTKSSGFAARVRSKYVAFRYGEFTTTRPREFR